MAEAAGINPSQSAVLQRRVNLAWLGVVPFFLFATAFLLLPAVAIIVQSFRSPTNSFTLDNIGALGQPFILSAYLYTIRLSAVTAVLGGLFGFALAYAVTSGALPLPLRGLLLTFSGVASNFAGLPLAFAFIATLGQLGLVTQALRQIGIALYPTFSLYSFWGLALVYLYFQIPLMVLIMIPTLEGMRREWREAAASLGASTWHYWRYVGLPVLAPALLGTMVLLFGNAFGAHATAFQLTGGGSQGSVITILIGAQLSSDALANPGLGNAMAFGMVLVMSVTVTIYVWLQRLSERWLQ
jgi:putative spermidine/putrescine transport system permease protein